MTNDHRDEIARRLATTAPAPEQTDSFFDGLGLLAAQSVATTGQERRHGATALRWSAVAASTVVLLSSAAYAGALGAPAKEGARQVIGHGTSASPGQTDDDPVEEIAPVFLLEPRPAGVDDSTDTAVDQSDSGDDSTDTAVDPSDSGDDSTDTAVDQSDSGDDSTDTADDQSDSGDDSTDESGASSDQGGDSSGHGSGDEGGGSSGSED